jgi:hypothetical protein
VSSTRRKTFQLKTINPKPQTAFPKKIPMPTYSDQIPTFRKIGRFFTSIFTWRRIRRLLLVSVSLVTLFAVYYTEEDWRGRRMWDAYIKELAAQSVPVTLADLDKFKPVPVPDDQNFWMAPAVKQLTPEQANEQFSWDKIAGENPPFGDNSDLEWALAFRPDHQNGGPYDGTGHFVDIVAWEKALNQPDLLEGFKKLDPDLDAIAKACQRPFVRPPSGTYRGSTWDGAFWYQDWDLGEVFELRGLAEFDAGQMDRAAGDAVTLLGSCDPVTGMRVFDPTNGLQLLWEGLAKHRWTDSQLAAIQAALQKVDYFPLLAQGYRRSTPYLIKDTEDHISDPAILADRIRPHSWPHRPAYGWYWLKVVLYPKGLMYQNYLEDLQDYETMYSSFDVPNRKVDGVKLAAQRELFIKNHPETNERVETIAGSIAESQEIEYLFLGQHLNKFRMLDLAVVACGLERYRLANGQFPEKLDDIAPRFLAKVPNDIVGGGPLHYRRLESGWYLLYGVGDDGKDYGGIPGLDLWTTSLFSKSDLVWPGLPKAK